MNDSKLNDPDNSAFTPINGPDPRAIEPPIETVENWDSLRGKVRVSNKTWRSPSRRYYHGVNDVW
jgi:hypothetical protein